MHSKPPKIAHWILERLVDENARYTAMRDFEEQYIFNAENKGILAAWFIYWFQIFVVLPFFFTLQNLLECNHAEKLF